LLFPDISLLDFSQWWYVKYYVYRTSVDDIATFPARIIEAVCSVVKGC
jgi:hypothetical protein